MQGGGVSGRRTFLKSAVCSGITGILAAGSAPAFAKDMKLLKIGQLGLGGHNFALSFKRHREEYKDTICARPYAFWDDYPGVNERFKSRGFEQTYDSPEEVVKNSDVICIEHVDYRRSLELAQPALEAGKPVFIDRPYTGSIYTAERIVELAREHDAPLMACSSLELQPELPEIRQWVADNGPVRSYECYCPEPMFPWMFPHTINFAHAAVGGGIDTAYFAGDYVLEMGDIRSAGRYWYDPNRPLGDAVSLLTYAPRDGQPPIIGINHIGPGPGTYNIFIYTVNESRNFIVGKHLDDPKIFLPMFLALNTFFAERTPPRPYEAILEQHRAHVATGISQQTGQAVKLDMLGGDDSLPYSESIRDWVLRAVLGD
jgi:hypothetical protein